jgi:hypothetical protein
MDHVGVRITPTADGTRVSLLVRAGDQNDTSELDNKPATIIAVSNVTVTEVIEVGEDHAIHDIGSESGVQHVAEASPASRAPASQLQPVAVSTTAVDEESVSMSHLGASQNGQQLQSVATAATANEDSVAIPVQLEAQLGQQLQPSALSTVSVEEGIRPTSKQRKAQDASQWKPEAIHTAAPREDATRLSKQQEVQHGHRSSALTKTAEAEDHTPVFKLREVQLGHPTLLPGEVQERFCSCTTLRAARTRLAHAVTQSAGGCWSMDAGASPRTAQPAMVPLPGHPQASCW